MKYKESEDIPSGCYICEELFKHNEEIVNEQIPKCTEVLTKFWIHKSCFQQYKECEDIVDEELFADELIKRTLNPTFLKLLKIDSNQL